jgi:hypothetical protein
MVEEEERLVIFVSIAVDFFCETTVTKGKRHFRIFGLISHRLAVVVILVYKQK